MADKEEKPKIYENGQRIITFVDEKTYYAKKKDYSVDKETDNVGKWLETIKDDSEMTLSKEVTSYFSRICVERLMILVHPASNI